MSDTSPEEPLSDISGGATIEAGNVEIGGDVVGRDKLVAGGDIVQGDQYRAEAGGVVVGAGGQLRQTIINLPRAVQIGVGVAVLAVVAIAVVLIVAEHGRQSEIAQAAQVNTHFVFDTSQAMADPERLAIARSVLGNEAFLALRREQLGLRVVGGGCEVPIEPRIPLGSNQVDQIVAAVDELQPGGDAALVESIKAAADDLPLNAKTNAIIVVSAGQDTCLIRQNIDPCTQMSRLAQKLEETEIRFTLNIVALKPDEQTRQNLTCLARANVNGYFYEANTPEDLQSILTQIEPSKGVPGVANGSFESGQADSWQGEGIEVVTVEDSSTPAVGKYAAQIRPGSALEQSVTVPIIDQPQLSVWYRAPDGDATGRLDIYVNDQLSFSDATPADRNGKLVAAQAPDWLVAVVEAAPYAGQTVTLRVEYVPASARSGGVLRAPTLQGNAPLWIDNVAILTERQLSSIVASATEATPTPSATPSARMTPTPTTRASATSSPTLTHTPTRRPTAAPLSFRWTAGAVRTAGQNAQGIGIWAERVSVAPSGGTPPYTITFQASGQQATGSSFEVFGLNCIGQVGTIAVQDARGTRVSQNITIPAPFCPTETPTPTPTLGPPPAPRQIQPQANSSYAGDFESCIAPQFEWEPAEPDLPPDLWDFYTISVRNSDLIEDAKFVGSGFVGETGNIIASIYCLLPDSYEWRVRAERNDGQIGPWSPWVPFVVYVPDL